MDIVDIGLCATPMLYFSIRHFGVDGGVMITGSHNPPEFNGFKICMGPDTIYGEEIQELRRIIENETYLAGKGSIRQAEITDAYREYLYRNVTVGKGLKVVIDGGNGVGGTLRSPYSTASAVM